MNRGVLAISQHLEAQAQLVVVAAASYDGGYHAGRERGEVVIDRYLSALRVVFERVVLLAREACVPRVELTIASRHVLHRQLGKPINLRPSDVGSAIQDTIGYPYLDEVDGFEHRGVRFVVQSTPTYDEHVHPGVVVADFASNRLLGRIYAKTHRLSKMESNSFGPLSTSFRGVRVPLLACDGEPSQLLRDGLRGSDVASALRELPVDWRREQVERWLEVAR
ncbi:MAG: hypothetical protein KF901_32120 [Myxococcales bacterium]|nr:hypothetical protein [Myxococcales bacterium]